MREKKVNRIINKEMENSVLIWVKQSKRGDIKAFELIYEHFKTPVFNLVYRYTYNHAIAEDLVHDIFIKIFTKIKNLREEKSFPNWLYRIAINTCLNYLRKRKRAHLKSIPLDEARNLLGNYISIEKNNTINEILEWAISNLPLKMKTIFLLHDVQGFKHEEIARILKCSVGTSKSQLFKARMKIREYLIKIQREGNKNEM